MKRSVLLIPLLLALSLNMHAQITGLSTLNSAGGSFPLGTNEFEWSIGEMTLVNTFTGSNVIVTQGILQPVDAPSGVATSSLLNQQLQVFPNPATSEVNVQYISQAPGTIAYRLMDMTGKIISDRTTAVKQGTNTEQVNISELACATYMLEVIVNPGSASSESASYKIQKLK